MTSLAKASGPMPIEDPFTVSSGDTETLGPRQRYSGFGAHGHSIAASSSSLANTSSPRQLKRALEAHIAETNRRLGEASHVGQVLLQQKQELSDRLKDLEHGTAQDEEGAIAPELRKRLAELEREFAETSRETAKIFVPKSRAPSGENGPGAESSEYHGHTSQSPSKIQPPSRKLRNQPQSRINDVKLAAEISESLLAQVRQLQSACSEKEDLLKRMAGERDQLELDMESAKVKIRTMDQEEQRYREENWTLETQVQDLSNASKAAVDQERRLTASLATVKQEKAGLEREHEELRAAHGQLTDEHTAAKKHHDLETGALRRDVSATEAEATSLKRRVDNLTVQNEKLAAMAARLQADGIAAAAANSGDVFGKMSEDDEGVTPEPSPPPSPSKATPRHGGLESETLKSSLQHAQRMIQHLKNNIHREKTEKMEMRRLLQEARDEVDDARKKNGPTDAKRGKARLEAGKKPLPRSDRLGAARSAKNEFILEADDGAWEDNGDDVLDQPTPSKSTMRPPPPRTDSRRSNTEASTDGEAYVTATENSDMFETATENSHAEDDSEGDLTETEGSSRPGGKRSSRVNVHRFSMQSTASTSDDEEPETPAQASTYRVGSLGRYHASTSSRNSSAAHLGSDSLHSTPTITQDSPSSVISGASGTPGSSIMQGRSLFAELDDLDDNDSEQSVSVNGTPASVGKRSVIETPEKSVSGSVPGSATLGSAFKKTPLPSRLRSMQSYTEERTAMVDAGTMTDPEPVPEPIIREATPPAPTPIELSRSSILSTSCEPVSETEAEIIAPEPIRLVKSNISSMEIIPTPSPPPQQIQKFKLNRSNGASRMKDTGTDAEPLIDDSAQSQKPVFGSLFRRKQAQEKTNEPIVVAEDPVSVNDTLPSSFRDREVVGGPDGRIPFKAVDGNAVKAHVDARGQKPVAGHATQESPETARNPVAAASTTSTQTMLSAKDIETLFDKSRASNQSSYVDTGISAVSTSPKKSRETAQGIVHSRRPGSSGSNRSGFSPPPPLPAEAKEVIAAAAAASAAAPSGTLQGQRGSMGPPIMPASAYSKGNAIRRPRTPVNATPSVRHSARGSLAGRSEFSSPVTRRSSVTSFASEVDARFNLGTGHAGPFGGPASDPRMIQAVTQTMIGEPLWKYTHRPGGALSMSNRHKRFFWVHPYTRTLYWSEKDPTSTLSRAELRSKAAPIEGVEVVNDSNPNPSGLADRSLIVHTTGRKLKLTASSRERHQMWVDALSYLLLKTEDEDGAARAEETSRMANLTEEEVNDYVAPPPPEGIRSESRATARSRFSTASLASRYQSTVSRHRGISPSKQGTVKGRGEGDGSATVRRSQSVQPGRDSHMSIGSRFSSVFRTPGRYSRSLRDEDHGRDEDDEATPRAGDGNSQAAQEQHMENVRACCNGKHDVGSVSHMARHDHHGSLHSLSNTINSMTGRGKRSSVAGSLATNHSRRRSQDTSGRRSQSVRRGHGGLEMMDPANIVG